MAQATPTMSTKLASPGRPADLFRLIQMGALVIGVVTLFYLLVQGINGNGEKNTGSLPSAAKSLSQASVSADNSKDAIGVNTEQKHQSESALIKDIRFATKGDGAVREVDVNGKKVDSVFVKLAAFENNDFVLRDEPQLIGSKAKEDAVLAPQRSHFRALTYPLANLGNDYFRNGSTDTRVNVSDSGGRL